MEQPKYKGDANAYLQELCEWADTHRTPLETITVDVDFTIFGMAGKKPEVAAVSNRPISKNPLVNMGVYRRILERKIELKDSQISTLKQKVEELETMFAEELRAKEEKMWEEYGEDL